MKKLKTIIIEDEQPARDLVKFYLKDFPEIELIDECDDGFKGIKSIQEHKPDLIFLDIQMPKLSGFELLELLDEYPQIIFTTAYDQYALKAFELNAVDYLLKPFSKERFRSAVEKAMEKLGQKNGTQEQAESLNRITDENPEELTRIVVRSSGKIVVIPVDSVSHFEAEDDYVMIFSAQGKHLKKATMKFFESRLDSKKFIRVHRSCIVNVDFITKIELMEKEMYLLILKDNSKLKVSKSGYKLLRDKLDF
ncbi:MAG: DNA-binding response regulator [Bacteroidetes bacterium GWF2_38_335]|nr:MAG: DNA-binding response regulator [Bacteroidetes bacterium GWF2_38_335]OFY78823.1 MAG: DNA-binding response regulator [Bacteroidetes bacterium RIFOXYA12_FULL_38_20]HBS85131.1 DNA-binding response regulator [Bacteroidales bacterium]